MSNLDLDTLTGDCASCGRVKLKKKQSGYRCKISEARWKYAGKRKDTSYQLYKESTCSKCGFVPVDSCQLDVDHIDNNKDNNERSNLQTLCANCHRLKSHNCVK